MHDLTRQFPCPPLDGDSLAKQIGLASSHASATPLALSHYLSERPRHYGEAALRPGGPPRPCARAGPCPTRQWRSRLTLPLQLPRQQQAARPGPAPSPPPARWRSRLTLPAHSPVHLGRRSHRRSSFKFKFKLSVTQSKLEQRASEWQ